MAQAQVVDPGDEDEAVEAARAANLVYVSDESPGIRRRRSVRGFTYLGPDGQVVRQKQRLNRIRALAVPPAWTDVWICPNPRGHLQATGRDQRGRKQYRYHARWREVRDANKYGRMAAFGRALPRLRRRVGRDLSRPGLDRRKVVATIVRLLDLSSLRVGNAEYARDNGSFVLTTLRERHVKVEGGHVRFHFKGKGGKEVEADLRDRRVARVIRRCQDLPGQKLFRYLDAEGEVRDVESADVNEYLREVTGEDFTAKDFRTWAGTVLAAVELARQGAFEGETDARRRVAEAIRAVAGALGNTQAVCRRCYVHPAVIDGYLAGRMIEACQEADAGCERAVLALLEREAKAA